jgi:hypothetical protein
MCQCGDDMSICGLLFQWASTIKIQLPGKCVGLVQSWPHHHLMENLFSPWYSWKIAELELNNNHSLTWFSSLISAAGDKVLDVAGSQVKDADR